MSQVEQATFSPPRVIILGGGVAGLSVGFFLAKKGVSFKLYEKSLETGGMARSFNWSGVYCDLAPHRFLSEDTEVLDLVNSLVKLNEKKRASQIFLKGKWINDPVNIVELLIKFFPSKSFILVRDFFLTKFFPPKVTDSFEGYVLSRYGNGLHELFFKPYAEKLFGIGANQISAHWGKMKVRVSGLMDIFRRRGRLYFDRFYYPKEGGYGAIVSALFKTISSNVYVQHELVNVEPIKGNPGYVCSFRCEDKIVQETCDILVSTIPLPAIAQQFDIPVDISFRELKLIYILVDRPRVMNEHWRYFVDVDISINRVTEFKNFSDDYNQEKGTVICAEVTSSETLDIDRVLAELVQLELITAEEVLDTKVLTVPNAYPIYSIDFETKVNNAINNLSQHKNLITFGRQGQFAHLDVDEVLGLAQNVSENIASLATDA